MDRLELALRRYSQLVPKAVHLHVDVPQKDLEIWLREDVSPVLEDYASRPTFREHALWPITTFKSESQSPEKALIDQFALESKTCATALVRLAQQKLMQRKLQELFPPIRGVLRETVRISGKGTKVLNREYTEYPQIEPLHRNVEAIARPLPPPIIGKINDYFEPEQHWSTLPDGKRIQHAEWIVSLNSDLLPIGNFIVRCLLKRIELRIDPLTKYRRMCSRALSAIGPKYRSHVTGLEDSWRAMSATHEKIVGAFRSGQTTYLRDACVAATQLYAAIHPRPDVSWLGLDEQVIKHGAGMLRSRITGLQSPQVFDRIATALGDLKHLYIEQDVGASLIEQLIAVGGLVIDEDRRTAYWETRLITVAPKGTKWNLFLALARKARHGAAVGISDVYPDTPVSNNAITTAWSRLKKDLPPSLRKHIVPGDEPGTYRLKLESSRIHMKNQRDR